MSAPPKGRTLKVYRLTEKGHRIGDLVEEFLEEVDAELADFEGDE